MTKKNALNLAGFILDWLVYIIASIVVSFIFGFLLKIPLLVRILSWPVSVDYYVTAAVNTIPFFFVVPLCNRVCQSVTTKRYIGTVIFSISVIMVSIVMVLSRLIYFGYSYHVVGYGIAGLTAVFVLFEGTEKEKQGA